VSAAETTRLVCVKAPSAGTRIDIKMIMIEMTTRSSVSDTPFARLKVDINPSA
jgi:hypothetical protein